MKIRISERHTKLSPAIRQTIKEKIEGLERYFDRIISIDAIIEGEKDHFIARMVAHVVRKKVIKAEVTAADLQAAVGGALENLKSQLTRFKDQLKDHRGDSSPLPEQAVDPLDGVSQAAHGEGLNPEFITRTEVHLRKPMTVAEALLQLDAHNRDLYLFDDAEGGGLRILHRHANGQIELLEPKF